MWSLKHLLIGSFSFFYICYGQAYLQYTKDSNVENYLTNSTNENINVRIVGGRPLKIIDAPYQVALFGDGVFVCGGSIISADWILTAAHCIEGSSTFKIRAGSPYYNRGGKMYDVRFVAVNMGYSLKTVLINDIALMRLKERLKWSKKIRPARLAKSNFKLPKKLQVSGWGSVNEESKNLSNILRGVTVSIVPKELCKKIYKLTKLVSSLVICAASPGKDTCTGDSGGALIYKNIQYGITSFGFGCGHLWLPGIYTNISTQNAWIKYVIQSYGGEMPNNL